MIIFLLVNYICLGLSEQAINHKFLLAHNVTFMCYSAITGALSHVKLNRKLSGYQKPIQSTLPDKTYN